MSYSKKYSFTFSELTEMIEEFIDDLEMFNIVNVEKIRNSKEVSSYDTVKNYLGLNK